MSYTDDAGRPRNVQDVEREANEITDASLDATRRMLRQAEETREVASKTNEELHKQGDQLRRIEQNADHMDREVKIAEKSILNMEKCCGCCGCICCRAKNMDKSKDHKRVFSAQHGQLGEDGVIDEQPMSVKGAGAGGRGGQGGQYINRITNDAREDEMEQNLSAVGGILADLKQQASAMGDELNDQNEIIDRNKEKIQMVDTRVVNANTRTAQLLKNA
eukprot:m.179561 g.179561  ORF g.179561 m.179561 type:complete len:219 (-) comp15479_c0_seq3:1551-2207(-)